MSVFDIISLLGGLAMFLYGMRLMGDSLKEGSSGTLKVVIEKVTNNPIKAFLLGLLVTVIIQSSTATIVITSGLVAAGILSLHQSLGIILGANLGTTITGQIIRLMGLNADSASFLRIFQPSTLAPVALIIGIILIMFFKFRNSHTIGNIAIGFGILFSGLLNMSASVTVLSESGLLDHLFSTLGDNVWLAYLVGAGVAFMLQSSSATVGILQTFALAGTIPFKTVYVIIVGIYLGDCLTTGIVCWIGAQTDAKRVGIVNIIYNLAKTILVILVVTLIHQFGGLATLWNTPMTPGTIANANSIFNLACALLLLPFVSLFEKLTIKLVKDKPKPVGKYSDKLSELNPVFFATPALAFRSCYDILLTMLDIATSNIYKALDLFSDFNRKQLEEIEKEEDSIDEMTDSVCNYLMQLSPHVKEDLHISILDQYNKIVTQFERLGDHAMNIAEAAESLHDSKSSFTEDAMAELSVVRSLLDELLQYTRQAFEKRDAVAARHIEPLEDVMDDMVNKLHDNHLIRLRLGLCSTQNGILFLDVLSNLERISDTCSNVGISVVARVNPDLASLAHNYVTSLHQGSDEQFNKDYQEAHNKYFSLLEETIPLDKKLDEIKEPDFNELTES